MKKILFCDMDGTIIDEEGLLYPNDKVMIERYRGCGNIFVFNTGRNIEEARRVIVQEDLAYDYLILNNGGYIIDKNDNILYKQIILKDVGIDIIKYCLQYNNLWIQYFDGKKTLAYYQGKTYIYGTNGKIESKEDDFLKEYPKVTEFDIIAINQDDQQLDNVLKVQAYIAKNYASGALGTLNQYYLDITPSNCSKGNGAANLIKLIDENLISYAIGDSYNDISMFEYVNSSYTFNRVSEDIKKHSSGVVDNLSELIEKII